MKELAKNLEQGNLKNCYLFHGEEKHLIDIYEERMKKFVAAKAGAPGEAGMNIDVFVDKESVANIINAIETMPFFCDYRLVIVKNSGLLASGRKDDSALMAQHLKDLPETTIIVFIEDNIDKRNVVYKAILQAGEPVEFKRPTEAELISWVAREMKLKGVAIDKNAALYLIRATSANMESLAQEMTKLAAYCKGRGVATQDNIDAVCTKGIELKVFALVDALAHKNKAKALQIFENLMEAKESPILILSLIARQFRFMLACSAARSRSSAEIAAAIGAPPFAIKECMKQARNFSEAELVQMLKDCLEMDIGIKTGRVGDRLAVEVLIGGCGGV